MSMPYASIERPSIALGILKSVLSVHRVSCEVRHANLTFAERAGLGAYDITEQLPAHFLAGEWTFAEAAFRNADGAVDAYLDEIMMGGPDLSVSERACPPSTLDALRHLRAEAPGFIDEMAADVLSRSPKLVGCTSTFQQHAASLALLRRLRELDPEVITMIGGANCETVMGRATHRCFPWVDYVVSGEADRLIVNLCDLVLEHGRAVPATALPPGVIGPCHRSTAAAGRSQTARATFHALDSLPVPDFDDYFTAWATSPLRDHVRPGLPLETSRGCWWGAKHHCTFCGLNGSSMQYHAKSPEHVLRELQALEDRYGVHDFEVVDNILDTAYYTTLLPALAQSERRRRFFYEIKANVTEDNVRQLVEAGVTWVQPGIESLHSDVLRLMDKGTQAWKNVQLLKWARETGLRMSWSVIWDFPAEQDEWYLEMARLVPYLEHLQPPGNLVRLRFDRFSVYHERADELGLSLRPVPAMRHVYPLPDAELADLAYYFAGGADDPTACDADRRPGVAQLRGAVARWKASFAGELRPVLCRLDRGDSTDIIDTRTVAARSRQSLAGLDAMVCVVCDGAPPEHGVARAVTQRFGVPCTIEAARAAADRLIGSGLVVRLDGRLVGLTLRSELPDLPRPSDFPGGHVTH